MSHPTCLRPIDRPYNPRLPLSHSRCSIFVFLSYHLDLRFILYTRVPKFLCSVAFLTVNISLSAISEFTCGHLLFRSSSFHLRSSGHFKNTRGIRFPLAHIRSVCPSPCPNPPPVTSFPDSQPEPRYNTYIDNMI